MQLFKFSLSFSLLYLSLFLVFLFSSTMTIVAFTPSFPSSISSSQLQREDDGQSKHSQYLSFPVSASFLSLRVSSSSSSFPSSSTKIHPLFAVKKRSAKSTKSTKSSKSKRITNDTTNTTTDSNDNDNNNNNNINSDVKLIRESVDDTPIEGFMGPSTQSKEEVNKAMKNVQNRGRSTYAQQLLEERKEEEIRMKNELVAMKQFQKEREELISTGGGNLPEKVSNRILSRMIPFLSIPVLFAIGMFFTYFYLAKEKDIYIPPYIVAYSTFVPFIFALLGITYSVLSASWEEEVEGSKLGINEFRKNLGSLFDSLQYNKKVEQMDETAQKYQERYGKDINDLDENSLSVGNREQRRRQNKTRSK